jgi:hypothetical protein
MEESMEVGMRSRRLMVTAITSAAALACLVVPSAASALGFEGLTAAPDDPQAGAHSNFNFHVGFTDPGDHVQDLTIHLPPGLVGNPTATPLCTPDEFNSSANAGNGCPAETQVGQVMVHATALGLPLPTVNGRVFNMEPQPGEPARFGISLKALDVDLGPLGSLVLPPIKQQSAASLRQSDLGLDTSLNDIPFQATLIQISPLPPIQTDINITSMDISLFGEVGDPPTGFMRNPTSCGAKTTSFDANSWADESTFIHGSASYNSTGCASLPFDPGFTAHLGAPGLTGPNTKTPATTAITQDESEAGLKSAKVALPSVLGNDITLLNNTCPPAKFEAGTCPANSIVGSASATSPLLADAISGPVVLVTNPGGLAKVGLDLRGALSLKLQGSIGVNPTSVIFDGLPDIPISTFQLHFNPGLLIAQTDLCQPPAPVFHTDFNGHNGAHTSGDTRAIIDGCGKKGEPTASLKLKKKKSKRPKMKLNANAGINAITNLSVKLPKPLKFAGGKKWKRGAKGSDDSGKLPRSDIKHSKKKLKLNSDADGTEKLSARIRKGALRRVKRYRKRKLSFPTKIVDASGHTTSLKLKVKVKK